MLSIKLLVGLAFDLIRSCTLDIITCIDFHFDWNWPFRDLSMGIDLDPDELNSWPVVTSSCVSLCVMDSDK
jgi:hypothetical protein